MRIIIAGSREFKNYEMLKKISLDVLAKLQYDYVIGRKDIEIVSGRAPGADLLGEKFAKEFGITVEPMPADWNNILAHPVFVKYRKDGKPYNVLAGKNRNTKMAEYASQDKDGQGILIAFSMGTDGTADMIAKAKKYGLNRYVVNGHTGDVVHDTI